MIENILEKREEMKKIWLEHKDKLPAKIIFENYLKEYFDTTLVGKSRDWIFFVQLIKVWKEEIIKNTISKQIEVLSDKDAEEMQLENIKRSVVFLNNVLKRFEADPEALKGVDVSEVIRLLKTIEGSAQARERTKIEKGKLKLDAFKTFFSYQRLSIDELTKLAEEIGNAINEFRQLEKPKPVSIESGKGGDAGQTPLGAG
jgi:hypothetical protein